MENTEEMVIGKVSHFFPKIGVAVVDVTEAAIKVGDEIHVKGHTTDFRQKVISIQMEHESIEMADKGMSVGMKVEQPVRTNDLVYKAV